MNKEPKDWITINGQHVPIFEGEGKREATSRFINKKMSRVQKNKDKYDKINKFKERKQSNLKVKYNKTNTGVEVDEEDRKRIMKELGYDKDNLSKNFDAKDNKYEMKKEEREKVFKKLGIHDTESEEQDEPTPIRKDEQDTKRRENLIKFTQENKEQIKKWADEYDEETNKRAFEKAKRGEGLTAKEYFGFIGSEFKPGSVILEEFADGENAIVANDGNWVRESRIKDYNKNPRANQDAVYNEERENDLKWEKEERENPRISVEEMRKKFANQKNPFRDDEFIRKELEKERIEEFKRRKKTNK